MTGEPTTVRTFPEGFAWGVASAAYQIEGGATEGGRGPSIWDTFSHRPGTVIGGDTGDVACDHFHRWPADLDLIAELGVPHYRFSVSWARVMPDGRTPNREGIDFYRRLVEGMRERGITPLMTLYHWDLPEALDEGGTAGWLARETADHFADFALLMGRELGDLVPTVTTFNEPWCSAYLGYASGEHAPGHTDNGLALRAAHHLNLAHGRAVTALRSVLPTSAEVSLTLNLHQLEAASQDPADLAATRHVDAVANRIFLDPVLRGSYPDDLLDGTRHLTDWSFVEAGDLEVINAPIDVLGVNFYNPTRIAAPVAGEPTWPGTDRARAVDIPGPKTVMGWPIVPSALTDLLLRVHRDYGVPVVITENGCSGHDVVEADGQVHDEGRIDYLRGHLTAVADALGAGADVRGYYLWTLLDNFEWAWGYGKRFGIVHVDFETQRRTVKDSGWWYRDVVRRGGLV
jgi:beta-glucosidase